MRRRRELTRVMLVVGVLVAAFAMVAIPARADYAGQTSADEPQYLLTALSLGRSVDLDIGDDLTAQRYRPFYEGTLPRQTEPMADGREVSPHDPLLPALLAVPMRLGGWVAAKVTLALVAGALAALSVWVASRRFGVPPVVAGGVVAAFAVVPPLTTYGTQVYPELPAALAVTVAVAAVTGRLDRRGTAIATAAIVALPWLAVKYTPVAAVLALLLLSALVLRSGRGAVARAVAVAVSFAVAGVAFLVVHKVVYGGWTAYAAGSHFAGGELTVMGTSPDYAGRSVRLLGLLVDRNFGLAAWAPAFLLVIPAAAALVRRRPTGWLVLALPFAAGWLNATFVALTMHGWWWPGRQVVVVLPLAVIAVAWFAGRVRSWHALRPVVGVATAFGVLCWVWLLVEVGRGPRTLIVDFAGTGDPFSRAWRALLPDDRVMAGPDVARYAAWTVVALVLAAAGWRAARRPSSPEPTSLTEPALDVSSPPEPPRSSHHVHLPARSRPATEPSTLRRRGSRRAAGVAAGPGLFVR